jgi:hypothetical protein
MNFFFSSFAASLPWQREGSKATPVIPVMLFIKGKIGMAPYPYKSLSPA